MAKIMIIILVVLMVGLLLFVFYIHETRLLSAYETQSIQIGNTELAVYIADTPEKRARGLMEISTLSPCAGMMFLFPDTSIRTFWNKNTLIDLDILWIADGHVVGISTLPAVTQSSNVVTVSSPVATNIVVEVNKGWAEEHGIEVGDVMTR